MNPNVDAFVKRAGKWQAEIEALRAIALSCGLDENLKWGQPCYSLREANVVLIHAFKDYCAYLFFKGALLKDPKKLLVQQTQNVQAARQIRFTGMKDITPKKAALKAYIKEAIAVEKSGANVAFKKTSDFPVVVEFRKRLAKDPELEACFKALTPGRQRAYLLYFSSAKQSATRESRIDKCAPQIMKGKGLDD